MVPNFLKGNSIVRAWCSRAPHDQFLCSKRTSPCDLICCTDMSLPQNNRLNVGKKRYKKKRKFVVVGEINRIMIKDLVI